MKLRKEYIKLYYKYKICHILNKIDIIYLKKQFIEKITEKLSVENNKLQKEKLSYLQRTRKSINQYIQMIFGEIMSECLNQLNEEQIY